MKGMREGKTALLIAAVMAVILLMSLFGSLQPADGASDEECRIAEVLSTMAGAGRVEVALFYAPAQQSALGRPEESAKPTGAVVVAQGAGDLQVRLNLIRAIRTLLGLPENAVDVFVMEGER